MVVSQLNLLCEIVVELRTLGSIACTEGYVPSIQVKESQCKQLDRIAKVLCIADGQTVLDYLCEGELFVGLQSKNPSWIRPAVQPKRIRPADKDKNYRLRKAAKKAATAGGSVDANSNEEGISGPSAPDVEEVELVAPKPTKGCSARSVSRNKKQWRDYEAAKAVREAAAQAQATSASGTTPDSSHTRSTEQTPTGPNGEDAASVKKTRGPKRKPEEELSIRSRQRRKKEVADSGETVIRPKKVRS